jgi:hypothetical protein
MIEITNETVMALLEESIDSVTVLDSARGVPMVEHSADYELAVGEDGDLLIRVTPSEQYNESVA